MVRNSRGRGRLPPRSITTRGSTPAIEEEVIQPLEVATPDLLAPTPPQPSPTEHPPGGDQDATSEEPAAAARRHRPRGRTTRSCETSVAAGSPKPVIELENGNPVGDNNPIFKSTVYSWLKAPTVFNHGVTGFSKLNHHELSLFWKRVNDCFEFSEIAIDGANTSIVPPPPPPPPAPTGTSTPASSNRDPCTSSIASTPTQGPDHPDPMDCLRLHQSAKIVLRKIIEARYNDYRHDIRKKYFDVYTTQEERLANPPIGWPIDQWTFVVEYWGAEDYAKKRKQNIENRGKLVMKHTCGSESIPKKRVQIIRETGQSVGEIDLFVDTHTSKKTKTFLDEESRTAAEMMKEVAIQHTDESGNCTLSQREVFEQVVGPETKGRERMMGKTVGKKKGTKTIIEEDMVRVVEDIRRENVEDIRRENAETVARAVEAIRLENVANMQAAIQAMIASGQLMVPPTGPRHDEVIEEDNNRGSQ